MGGEKMETSHQKSSWKFKGEVPVPARFSCYARLRNADVFDPDEDARFAVVGGRLLLHLDKQHQLWEYEQNGDRWVQLAESTGNRTLAHIETTDEFMYSVVPVGDERIALISNGLVIEVVLGEGTADVQPRHGCAGVVREGSRHGPREAGPMTQSVDSLSLHSFVRQPTLGKNGWTVYVCGAASVCLLLTGTATFSLSQLLRPKFRRMLLVSSISESHGLFLAL
jgi:hypothetical protein